MKKLISLLGALIALIAVTVSSTACFWFLYQPATPKCLRK
ncbi:cyclic lactone autoinducer peptide [Clostridium thermosuccinogenes]|uniref:Cyclic lactone autoinducer peptide n=1 Tax=Clostridium thermosuccinogenes TaxID=84032 RepID=A0A2K2FKN4_9CLOT|nr:cyclic lactone autoinducer peptide [Pseudoclostridium thermosuccinogenes]AUS95959.1 cyclic lactone autoinducer peptide [Pseudoclostridium thermosuccinogenes]PNT99348.1 cyclic lactone autoinducer peptide [Pseudoclostridium thermosuccinogenes]PNU01035.1 cyclic lactone autoinducer peptide [Pseudoclostridium thermosuccinogenes]